ncbi:MAG TPA: glycosyltransferase family 87 protein [Candidatus Dormibacteraeota bacterium]|nr:glycosyltransferase family 87 protein [Candidatus Dormibacteraeota bacterium]
MRRLLGWPDAGQVALSALIGILLALYAARFLLPLLGPQAPRADDFQDYLFAAHQIGVGGDPYANFIRNHVPWDWSLSSGYLYPPAFAITLIPLTWVSNDFAVRIWLFLIQAAVPASLVIVYRVIGTPRRAELLGVVAVLTTFFPLANSVFAGAMNSLLLLLLTGAWACWRRRQDLAGGVLVGIATIFKLFPLALLPYLVWRRHWKLVGALCVTGVAGLGAGLVVTSIDHNIYYFRDMLPHLAAGTGYRENQSLAGFTARICQPSTADAGGSAGWCGRVLDWPLTLLLLFIVLRAVSRNSRTGLEFALAISALPLISSVTWSFHLVILILPIALLIRLAFSGALSRTAGRFLIAAWLCFSVLPGLHYLLIVHPLPHWPGVLDVVSIAVTRLAGEAYFIGTLIIFGSVWVALSHERRTEAAVESRTFAAA